MKARKERVCSTRHWPCLSLWQLPHNPLTLAPEKDFESQRPSTLNRSLAYRIAAVAEELKAPQSIHRFENLCISPSFG
jgi:hypothetical protein